MVSMEPLVCACGFYASTNTGNMCSKCHKDSVLNYSLAEGLLVKEREREATAATESAQAAGGGAWALRSEAGRPLPRDQNRCKVCKKRLSLTSVTCYCGLSFCGMHRYPEEHECSYDYKTEARKALANQLVRVPHPKFQRM